MYLIVDLRTSQTVATRRALQTARNCANKRNLAYGAVRYIVMVQMPTI
jgi:hypothetical protein